jgi:hypothetical protein
MVSLTCNIYAYYLYLAELKPLMQQTAAIPVSKDLETVLLRQQQDLIFRKSAIKRALSLK